MFNQSTKFFTFIIIQILSSHSITTAEEIITKYDVDQAYKNIQEKFDDWRKKLATNSKTKKSEKISNELKKVYTLLDMTVFDSFLEIENICLNEFSIADCFELSQKLIKQWGTFSWKLKMDSGYIQSNIEIVLASLDNVKIYPFMKTQGYLDEVFAQLTNNRETILKNFKK